MLLKHRPTVTSPQCSHVLAGSHPLTEPSRRSSRAIELHRIEPVASSSNRFRTRFAASATHHHLSQFVAMPLEDQQPRPTGACFRGGRPLGNQLIPSVPNEPSWDWRSGRRLTRPNYLWRKVPAAVPALRGQRERHASIGWSHLLHVPRVRHSGCGFSSDCRRNRTAPRSGSTSGHTRRSHVTDSWNCSLCSGMRRHQHNRRDERVLGRTITEAETSPPNRCTWEPRLTPAPRSCVSASCVEICATTSYRRVTSPIGPPTSR